MKKIIILAVAAVLMAGILAGCATTSGTTVKKGNSPVVTSKIYNNGVCVNDPKDPWPGNKPILSTNELKKIRGLPGWMNYPETFKEVDYIKNPIVGRITNNSNKECTFVIIHKITNIWNGEYKPDYRLEIKVPAHSTKYYIYDKPEMIVSTAFHLVKNNGNYENFEFGSFSLPGLYGEDIHNFDLNKKIFNEIESNHSEEFIYNGEGKDNYMTLIELLKYNKNEVSSNWVLTQ